MRFTQLYLELFVVIFPMSTALTLALISLMYLFTSDRELGLTILKWGAIGGAIGYAALLIYYLIVGVPSGSTLFNVATIGLGMGSGYSMIGALINNWWRKRNVT